MKNFVLLWMCIVFSSLWSGCSDCNDCLDLQQKEILVQDIDGNNLLFGETAIFDPEEATLTSEGEVSQPLFIDNDKQMLQFSLSEGVTLYRLQLNGNTAETIIFELGERESERCCGNQVFSTATELNGQNIANNDVIPIVK